MNDELKLLIDLHRNTARQGPGGEAETERALALAGIDLTATLRIADLGCGTGASTLLLAARTRAQITAVDLSSDFLADLEARARTEGHSDRIRTLTASMDALPFADATFDVLWSEGAIYNIGFEAGAKQWRRFLKPGGVLVVSEITWTTATRPAALQHYWEAAYPEIGTASAKLRVLEQSGYSPRGYFVLPPHCWIANYYEPLQASFGDFLHRHDHDQAARRIVDATREEMALYDRYQDHFSYGFYIASRADGAVP